MFVMFSDDVLKEDASSENRPVFCKLRHPKTGRMCQWQLYSILFLKRKILSSNLLASFICAYHVYADILMTPWKGLGSSKLL